MCTDKNKQVRYRFRETDVTGWENYDIADDDFSAFVDICCKYCTKISFKADKEYVNKSFFERMSGSLLEICVRFTRQNFTFFDETTYYYEISPEVIKNLKEINSIFIWQYDEIGMEDLTFYRADGSIFFESTTHEGYCDLFPRDDEDVSELVSKEGWEKNPSPMKVVISPQSWEEHADKLLQIKEEKYWEFVRRLKDKLSTHEKSSKDFLKNYDGILQIADKFGCSVDKVIEDFWKTVDDSLS